MQWICTLEDIADREGKKKKMIRTTSPHLLTHSTNIGWGEGSVVWLDRVTILGRKCIRINTGKSLKKKKKRRGMMHRIIHSLMNRLLIQAVSYPDRKKLHLHLGWGHKGGYLNTITTIIISLEPFFQIHHSPFQFSLILTYHDTHEAPRSFSHDYSPTREGQMAAQQPWRWKR